MSLANGRVYLDWNATAPLRPEAREAMIAAMDVVGNPSSVHAEGRAAKGLIERAREEIAVAFGAMGGRVVFTSGATEAAALALAPAAGAGRPLASAPVEHPCVLAWTRAELPADRRGQVHPIDPAATALQWANSETGIVQEWLGQEGQEGAAGVAVCDFVQAFGKLPLAFDWTGARMGLLSAHKIGGPKGVGALVLAEGVEIEPLLKGGGQEMGSRAGTENVIAIAGFAAAARAAARDLAQGVWEEVAELRDRLEEMLLEAAPDAIVIGRDAPRLPNTLSLAVPGWKGETQVMQMDLAGFAISAGSACSSGKVRRSAVLSAMGFDKMTAASAIRISLGPETRREDTEAFAKAWALGYKRWKQRADRRTGQEAAGLPPVSGENSYGAPAAMAEAAAGGVDNKDVTQ